MAYLHEPFHSGIRQSFKCCSPMLFDPFHIKLATMSDRWRGEGLSLQCGVPVETRSKNASQNFVSAPDARGITGTLFDHRQRLAKAPVRNIWNAQQVNNLIRSSSHRQPILVKFTEPLRKCLLPLRSTLVFRSALVPGRYWHRKKPSAIQGKMLLGFPGPLHDVDCTFHAGIGGSEEHNKDIGQVYRAYPTDVRHASSAIDEHEVVLR